ncbi:MAG TPA: endonuclease III [Dehalococcoidia bacterium]|nr:endonuclease III [Dehalococcoidia bacterium]
MPPASPKPRSRARPPKPHPARARIPEIIARLDGAYGLPEWRPHHDPTSELVLTILSQNTSDANSGRAFARLLEAFPSWDAVASAPLPALIAAIQPGGLAPTKAPRIQAVLRDIKERTGGSFDLSFLGELPLQEARDWLRALHGVGPKTVACVLLFALGRPAMPVDTHVFRVAMRLGLIPERIPVVRRTPPRESRQPTTDHRSAAMTPEKAHALLEAAVAPDDFYAFHIGLIKHGRRTCAAQRPRCDVCVLRDLCPSAAAFTRKPSQTARRRPG